MRWQGLPIVARMYAINAQNLRKACLIFGQRPSIRWLVETLGAEREDFAAGFGNSNGMFKLRRQRTITGYRRPAVFEDFDTGLAEVDHRFDGEEHAGLQFRPGACAASVAGVSIPIAAVAAARTGRARTEMEKPCFIASSSYRRSLRPGPALQGPEGEP